MTQVQKCLSNLQNLNLNLTFIYNENCYIKMFTWLSDLMNRLNFVVTFQWWHIQQLAALPLSLLCIQLIIETVYVEINKLTIHTVMYIRKKIPRFPPSALCLRFSLTYTCSWGFLAADNGHWFDYVGILCLFYTYSNCKRNTIYRINMTFHS